MGLGGQWWPGLRENTTSWQDNTVDGEDPVSSLRAAGRLLDMSPSSISDWRRTGKLGEPPWSLSELLAVRDRRDAPNRTRGVRTAHGSLARASTGCLCDLCLSAEAADQRDRDRKRAAVRFPEGKRTELLRLVAGGVSLKTAAGRVGVSSHQVWGLAQSDLEWGALLDSTLDDARSADLVHGRPSSYLKGCSCTECRAANRVRRRLRLSAGDSRPDID